MVEPFISYFYLNRGPQGVWTLEAKGEKPKFSKSFNEVVPTKTHLALKQLVDKGMECLDFDWRA
jgi:hypothetical protein